MLVASGRAASALGDIQLRRLAPRGHKQNWPRRQSAPSRPIHLMLVGAEQAASAFNTGLAGFEPTHVAVKVRCLTAWL